VEGEKGSIGGRKSETKRGMKKKKKSSSFRKRREAPSFCTSSGWEGNLRRIFFNGKRGLTIGMEREVCLPKKRGGE